MLIFVKKYVLERTYFLQSSFRITKGAAKKHLIERQARSDGFEDTTL